MMAARDTLLEFEVPQAAKIAFSTLPLFTLLMPNAAEDRAGEKSPSRKQSLFNGQVMIHTLERTDNPRARSEVQARLLSPNGELAVLSAENAVIRHLGYLELKHGAE